MDQRPTFLTKLFNETLRRKVFRVAAGYMVTTWVALQVASLIVPALYLPPSIMTILVLLSFLGFPLALILSWMFDITNEGLERTEEFDIDQVAPEADNRKKIPQIIIFGIIITIFFGLAYFVVKHSETLRDQWLSGSEKRIAVLPFNYISDDQSNDYFSEGLAEELINDLSKIKGLKVSARVSSFSFKDTKADLEAIGKKLKVGYVVDGSVRRSGNKLRVSAQLISVDSGHNIWSEDYSRELDDIFAVQEEITLNVLNALKITLLGKIEKQPTDSIEAHDLLLRARHLQNSRSFPSVQKSIDYFTQAIQLDTQYAEAYSGLAESWMLLAVWGYIAPENAINSARAFATQAIELNDQLASAYNVLAFATHFQERNSEKAEEYFERSLELEPTNPLTHNWYSVFLADNGEYLGSLYHLDRAKEADPLNFSINAQRTYTQIIAGNYKAALATAKMTLELNPHFIPIRFYQGWAMEITGNFQGALVQYQMLGDSLPLYKLVRATIHAKANNPTKATAILSELIASRDQENSLYVSPYFVAIVFAALKDWENSIRWLEVAVKENDVRLTRLMRDPQFEEVRKQAEFQIFLRDSRFNK